MYNRTFNAASRAVYVKGFGTARINSDGTITVTFNEQEVGKLISYARQRSVGSRGNNLYDQRRSQALNSQQVDQVGIAGEIAIALVTHSDVRISGSPDVGADHIIAGIRVDTKTTYAEDSPTLNFVKPPRGCDAAALVQVPLSEVLDKTFTATIIGWTMQPRQGRTEPRKLQPISTLISTAGSSTGSNPVYGSI